MPKNIELVKYRSSHLSSKPIRKQNKEVKQAIKDGKFLKQQMIIASKNLWFAHFYNRFFYVLVAETQVILRVYGNKVLMILPKYVQEVSFSLNDVLFDPLFCKAIWGEKEILIGFKVDKDTDAGLKKEINSIIKDSSWTIMELAWQYHIKKMVLSEDRLQYLKDHPGRE